MCINYYSNSGGDGQVQAYTPYCLPLSCALGFAPITVVDSEGNRFVFGDWTGSPDLSNSLWSTGMATGVLPSYVEDRNGNKLTFSSHTNSTPYTFTYTDSSGRPVIQAPYLGVTISQPYTNVYVSGFADPYVITYESLTASYNIPVVKVQPWEGCAVITGVNSGQQDESQLAIKSIQLPNGQSYQFGYDPVYGLLDSITYPDGASVSYTWNISSTPLQLATDQYSGGTFNNPLSIQQYSTPVITSRIVRPSGNAAAQTQSFSYQVTWSSIPNYSVGSAWSQRLTKVVTTDNVLSKSFETDYTYGFITQFGHWWDTWWLSNQLPVETSIQYFDWNGSLLKTITKGWNDQFQLDCRLDTAPNGVTAGRFYTYFYGLKVKDEKDFDYGQITASPISSACYNSVSVANGGSLIYTPAAPAPSNVSPLRENTTNFQQLQNLSAVPPQFLDIPSSSVIYDSSGTRVAETDYAYDQSSVSSVSAVNHDETLYSASGTTPRGNFTTITKQCFPTCGNSVTTYTYDETGQITSVTDPCGNATCSDVIGSNHTTHYSYADNYSPCGGVAPPSGNTNAYVTNITDPLGHQQNFCYGYDDGQLRSSEDPNSQVTGYKYDDPLHRLTETDYPDGGQTILSYNDNPSSRSITTQKLISSGQYLTSISTLDGVGHVTGTQLTTDPEGTDYSTTTYDGEGNPYQVSNPYRTTSDPTYGITTYSYDALGRTTKVLHPDSSFVQTTYTGRATEVADEGNGTHPVQRISQVDAFGRIKSVCEVTSATLSVGTGAAPGSCGQDIAATGFLTTYQYDGLNNLLQVSQGSLNPRTFTYNSLSQLVCSANPEIQSATCPASDPGTYTPGTIRYTYDPAGNLSSRTMPAPNQSNGSSTVTAAYQYDDDHRIIQKSYSDATTATSNFQYDTPSNWGVSLSNTIGRLSEASTSGSPFSATIYGYDALGRLEVNTQCTPENCGSSAFNLGASYDLLGDLASYGGAEGATISQVFDDAAHLTQVSSNLSDANHPATLLSGTHYNAFGVLTSASFGNGTAETKTYTQRAWPQSVTDTGIVVAAQAVPGTGSATVNGSEQTAPNGPGSPGTGTITISGQEQTYQYDECNVEYQIGTDDWMYCEAAEGYQGNAWAVDYGEVDATIDGVTATAYYDVGDTSAMVASRLASAITQGGAPVFASASGGVITLRATSGGVATDYPFSVSSQTNNTSQFSNPSFWASQSGTALTGGVDPPLIYDSGTVWLTTNGVQCSAAYASGDTTSTVASHLASAINSCNGSPVTATVSGATVSLVSKVSGSGTDYAVSAGSQTSQPGYFSQPSFGLSASGAALAGGQNAGPNPGTVYSYSVGYAPNGNVTSANDSANGNWNYAYDDLNRLTSAQQSGQPSYTYTYDRYGNRWNDLLNSSCTGAYTSCLTFNANNHISNGAVTYDAAGNISSDNNHLHYYYDAENRLIQVDGTLGNCASASACYRYDANGQRTQKTAYGASVDYYYDVSGHQVSELNSTGSWNRGEIYAGGRHLATYVMGSTPTTVFDHEDWLGTERARTNISMQLCESETSLPFGDGLNTTGSCGDPSPMHFTGKQRDNESGFDYFGARYYSSAQGRFVSADWSAVPAAVPYADLTNPQSLNLYTIVKDNPDTFADLDGHQDEDTEADTREDTDFTARLEEIRSSLNEAAAANAEAAYERAHAPTPEQLRNGWDDAIACHAPGSPDPSAPTISPREEPPQLRAGREAHNNEEVRPGERPEVYTPSRSGRMDRHNEDTAHIREIKPDNARGEKSGQEQLQRYKTEMEQATGRPHTTELTKYPPTKPPTKSDDQQ